MALNCEYVISQDDTTDIEIGALSTDGSNLFVSWKDGSTYGVDKIDFSNKYGSSYIEFLVFKTARHQQKEFDRFPCAWKPLPASTSVELKQDLDLSGSYTTVATADTDNSITDEEKFTGNGVADGNLIQLRLDLTVSSNNTPEIEELGIAYKIKDFK